MFLWASPPSGACPVLPAPQALLAAEVGGPVDWLACTTALVTAAEATVVADMAAAVTTEEAEAGGIMVAAVTTEAVAVAAVGARSS